MSGAIGALGTALANPPSAQPGYWQQGINNLTTLKDYQARNALAQIYQDPTVVDPSTGVVDQGRFNALMSASPQASWNAAGAMQAQGQAAAAQGQGVQEQMAAHRARMTQMLGLMNGLVAKGGPISGTDVMNAANQGHFSPGEMTQLTQDMNTANPGNDPSFDWSSWVKNHMAANQSAQDQINRVTPQMQMINTGNQWVPWDSNYNTNPHPANAPMGQGPGTQGDLVGIIYSDGTTHYFTRDKVAGALAANAGSRVDPNAPAGGGAGAAGAPTITRDPSVPVAGAQANNPGNLMFAGQPGASQLPLSGARVLAAFPDMPTGIAANANQILINQDQHGANTVRAMVRQWVNDPKADLTSYTNDTAKALGVDPDAPVNFHDPAVLQKFIMAQQPHETGGKGGITLNPADVTKGVQMALAPRGTQVAGPGAGPAPAAPASAASALPVPPVPPAPPRDSGFGASAFNAPTGTRAPAPTTTASAPVTTAAVPPVPTPQMAAARAVAVRTGRPAPIAGTDGLFVNPNGSVGSGPGAGGLGKRAGTNPLWQGFTTAQTTLPPVNALAAGPAAGGGPTPSPAPPSAPASAFGGGAFATPAPASSAPTPPVVTPQPQPPPAVAPQPAPPQAGVSPPLGYKTTVEGHATASVAMANAMHAQASQSPQRQALLADMDSTNKQINTGPDTEAATKWSAFANQLPDNISSLLPGMSREQVAGTEGFAKLAETFRQMQAGGIAGTLTNDKFASALASNPHLALSTLGNAGMIHLLQGSEDAIQAKDRAWSAASTANPGLDYQQWETNFNRTFDPRVFWWSRMERPEQQRLMAGMGQPQQQTLLAHLKQAEADGLITRPGGQGG